MIQPSLVSLGRGDYGLAELGAPLPLAELVPPAPLAPLAPETGRAVSSPPQESPQAGPPGECSAAGALLAPLAPLEDAAWEVEIGFGKGRYLLRRCREEPGRRFAGIELVAEYHRLFVGRARRRGLANWVALRGEALFLLSAVLPRAFAEVVHVYFPDPWPKSRHHKRRLLDPQTVDLVLGLLRPGGRLCFATDFLDYGELTAEILAGCPGLRLARLGGRWPEGPRTNYEAKYELEGRPILRLEATLERPASLHPLGVAGIVAAPRGSPGRPPLAAGLPGES